MKETYKSIEGFNGFYSVSDFGNVRNDRTGKILKRDSSHKYCRVSLSVNGKVNRFFIHRLVCKAFIQNIENKPCVNHIDCNVNNNSLSNLEGCTAKENAIHAEVYGNLKPSRLKGSKVAAEKSNLKTDIKLKSLLGDRFLCTENNDGKKKVKFKCLCGKVLYRRINSIVVERGGVCYDCNRGCHGI